MRVVIAGATGLVGSMLVERLLAGGTCDVHAIVRRATGRNRSRWHEHVAHPEAWSDEVAANGADKAVSALGTTWRAAGSEAAFRAVDLHLVTAFARAAFAAGARQMVTVSTIGADAGSRNFYLRTKGEAERSLEGVGFDRLDILRPGLLRGPRGGERRLKERVAIALSPFTDLLMRGRLDRYAAIDGDLVARAAANCLGKSTLGTYVHNNRSMLAVTEGET